MKKILGIITLVALVFTSCDTLRKTARTADVSGTLQNATVADLNVTGERITHTIVPSKAIQRAGLNNVKRAVEAEALTKYGNADVLVEPQYVIEKKRTFFGSKITSITVSGRPAYYTNFRSLNDSVWCNPVFRGVKVLRVSDGGSSFASKAGSLFKKSSNTYASSQAFRTRGYEGHVNFGIGATQLEPSNSWGHLGLSLLADYGYRFNPYFYLGVGCGIMYDEELSSDDKMIPLFINYRVNFNKKRVSPFIDFKGGYNFLAGNGGSGADGGPFSAIAVGVNVGNLEAALQFSATEFEFEDYYGGQETREYLSLGLSLGYTF